MKTFKNDWTPQVWEGVGPVLPTAVQDALTYYQQLLIMVNAINETRDNADKLADYTNTELNNIVDYLNERIRDFNTSMNEFFDRTDKAMNKFMQDETANREAFEAEMEAAFNQFTTDINNQWNEFKHTVEQWMDQMNSEWDAVKEAWEAVKAAWEQMKRDWEAFRNQMVSDFEQFKEEIHRLFNEYKNQTNEDLNSWKIATFNYFQGQYDSIKAALEAKLPDIVSNKLPDVLADYAGICLYYDPETRKINVGYDEGLARNGENKLIATGGGGTGGDTISGGNGIEITDVSGTKRIAVKIGQNLSFSDDGTLNATGGDSISAGNGIAITDENGVKRVAVKIGQNLRFSEDGTLNATGGAEVPIATADTVGLVKTGDKTKTGITISADGTISINQWTPIDVRKDFEFFDSNMTNVAPLWTLDMHYQPRNHNEDKTLYVRMSQNAIDTLGIPTNASIINWTPDEAWLYNTTPVVQSISTSNLLSNSTFKVTISSASGGSACTRNGTGTIQFSWQGKENVSTLQFKVIKSEMKLDPVHPISIGRTPIANNDTFKFTVDNWEKTIYINYNMADGTSISNTSDIRGGGYTYASEGRFEITNECMEAAYSPTPNISAHNIASGQVIFQVIPDALGISTKNSLEQIIAFNVEYDAKAIFDTWSIKLSSDTLVNFGATGIIQINNGVYRGQALVVTMDDEHILGIDRYNGKSTTMTRGSSKELYPNRNGTAKITVTTPYVSTLNMTKTVTVTENDEMKPHIKVTTNSTQIGDTSRDIANPATVDMGNLAKFSKSQGIITFWTTGEPVTYIRNTFNSGLMIGNKTISRWQDGTAQTLTYDFTNTEVGTKISVMFSGNEWRGAYNIIIGEVIE